MAAGPRPLDRFGIAPPPAYDMASWHLPMPLRDYQVEAVKALVDKKHGTILLPTAAGKSLVAIAIVLELRLPTVILVPTKALIDQTWIPALREAGITAGVYFGEEKRPGFVTISTYQSLIRNPEAIRAFPVVIFDEGDLTVGDVWKRVLEESKTHPYAAVITATLPPEKERRTQLTDSFPILIRRTPREMIDAGHFVPVSVVPRYVQLSPDLQRQYNEVDQRVRRLRMVLGTGNPTRIKQLLARGTPEQRGAAGGYLRLVQVRSSLLANVPERIAVLLEIARAHPGERVIAFGTRVEPLAEACAYLTASGIPCRIISGQTTREDRVFIFDHWGRDVQVVASVDVLTRGINVPEASVAVLLGGGAGRRRLIQRVGRIVRPSPGKTVATVYVVAAKGTTEDRLVQETQRIFAGGRFLETHEEEEGDDGGVAD